MWKFQGGWPIHMMTPNRVQKLLGVSRGEEGLVGWPVSDRVPVGGLVGSPTYIPFCAFDASTFPHKNLKLEKDRLGNFGGSGGGGVWILNMPPPLEIEIQVGAVCCSSFVSSNNCPTARTPSR